MSRRKQHKMSATFGRDAWAWRRIDRSLAIIQAAVVNWLTAIADTLPQLIKTWNTWAATFAAATQIVQGPRQPHIELSTPTHAPQHQEDR